MAAGDLTPGIILDGKWQIGAQLGRGGMGAVYAAVHVRNGNLVAIKVLHREFAQDEPVRERFLHEGYAANRVGHPSTVRVIDDGTTPEGTSYLVMERLQGKPLDAVADAAGGQLPVGQVVDYMLKLLDVLAAAHEKGIVHRDIKPENVFVCDNGALKVLDFGIAQVKEATNKARLTVTGVPMGTPAFMPPEQALAHWDEVDARSDVFAAGATMYNLLTGKLVHDARSLPELLVWTSTRAAQPMRILAPALPPMIGGVIDRALMFAPKDRWRNAREMLDALRAAAAGLSRSTLAAGQNPTRSIVARSNMTPRFVEDDDNVRTYRVVAASAPDLPRLPGATNTAAPVSSTPTESQQRRRAILLFALPVLALAGVAVGTAIFMLNRNYRPAATAPPTTQATEEMTATAAPSAPASVGIATMSVTTASSSASSSISVEPTTASASARMSSSAISKSARPAGSTRPPKPKSSKPEFMGFE